LYWHNNRLCEPIDRHRGRQLIAKADLLARLTPRAALVPQTAEAANALPASWTVDVAPILRFPFRVGRECRVSILDGKPVRVERPRSNHLPNNDLYLIDHGEPLHLSREHFVIDRSDGGYVLTDRGSACGLGVGELRIGGRDSGGTAKLRDGDVIAVGTPITRYRFAFVVLE
jgi:hypothetical protein